MKTEIKSGKVQSLKSFKKKKNKFKLKILVSKITKKNCYSEIDTGKRVGKEII